MKFSPPRRRFFRNNKTQKSSCLPPE